MRLVFPGGEHVPVDLTAGSARIGSGADCDIVLQGEGVAARHCEVVTGDAGAEVRVLDANAATVLNGRQVQASAPLAVGDLLLFGRVGCSISSGDHKAPPVAPPPAPRAVDVEAADDGRTRVRATLPKFILRGLSGPSLGKSFAIVDGAVIGRQPDCAIPINAAEISRQHVRLKPNPTGVHVEDLGSANGTFINDKRVQSAQLMPGDELRLDTVRFVLVAPGMDARQQAARVQPPPAPAHAAPGKPSMLAIVIGVVIALVVIGVLLRSAGAW
ncbi:MAG: FHA domain-containing protein [Xanthomonadales bacterium]|nr:FHA domain-containing protein [Xanthomonadales bacterium]